MNTQTPEAERVMRTCERYWKRTGVPRDRIAEMRAELETHLHEAAREGRPVDSVVGPDVTAFAEGWAREFRPPMVMSQRRAWGPALLALLAGTFTLWVALMMPVSSSGGGGGVVCCPRRVIESTSESTSEVNATRWRSLSFCWHRLFWLWSARSCSLWDG
jgi:hypothetical protein